MFAACEDIQLVAQGAEGKVYSTTFLSRPTIIKERVSKKYRVKELDSRLNIQRLRQEARCMVRCRRAGVLTPWCAAIIFLEKLFV
jgi:TP53 regulating kinase-like protein